MSGDPERPRRRLPVRWVTLAELLAIAAVAISGLTLWNSYRERAATEAEHHAEAAQSQRKVSLLILKAVPDKEGRTLTLAPRADEQAIQSQTIHFPTALALAPAETSGDPRIERGWIEDALVKARKAAGATDRPLGDARLPVLIVTHYLADGDPRVDRAVYELGYATSHALIGGTSIHLRGLSRAGSVADDAAGQRRIDALAKGRLG